MEALRLAAPTVAPAVIDTVMPRPGPQLGNALAFLISALRGGDLRGWLGEETVAELVKLRGAPAAQGLADDFSQLARLARTDAGDWRVYSLPLFDGGVQQQIRLYLKRRGAQQDDGEDAPARFIFEIDLSRLGPLQLDGLAARGRFDLVVRSTGELPEPVRREISALFGRVREENDFIGDVHFQTVPAFQVAPASQLPPHDEGLIV